MPKRINLNDRTPERHGLTNTPEYRVWGSMLTRCHNPRHETYPNYGGRGITVCDRWRKSFLHFITDMGPRPPGRTLDRRDNNQGYFKANCRWATRAEQAQNRSDNHIIEYKGEILCLAEMARKHGLRPHTLLARLKKGSSVEDALLRPVRKWTRLAAATPQPAPLYVLSAPAPGVPRPRPNRALSTAFSPPLPRLRFRSTVPHSHSQAAA